MCGENLVIQMLEVPLPGSPPHVRGKQIINTAGRHNLRITPACAGKTLLFKFGKVGCWDHPRMCGENSSWQPC